MVIGLGIDVVEIDRIERALDRFPNRFPQRILTEEELRIYPAAKSRAVAYLAARFAAKEAAVKALGTGFSQGIGFRHMEIRRHDSGRPELHLLGPARDLAVQKGVVRSHVSLTHGRREAAAVVILESD